MEGGKQRARYTLCEGGGGVRMKHVMFTRVNTTNTHYMDWGPHGVSPRVCVNCVTVRDVSVWCIVSCARMCVRNSPPVHRGGL